MRCPKPIFRALLMALSTMIAAPQWAAADLADVQDSGTLRHLGVPYANFVTGAGDGLDVELMQGFAEYIGVEYELVYTDFSSVVRDLLGQDVAISKGEVRLVGEYPIRGDVISTGFTVLPWRQELLLFSEPTFPSQVLLVAPAQSELTPIRSEGDLEADISATRAKIGKHSILVMEETCLDPAGYGLTDQDIDLRRYTASTNLNEMVPAMLDGMAQATLLDVPDVLLDLRHWAGQIKIIGPISREQVLATAFPKDAENLRDAFNEYLAKVKADGSYEEMVDRYYPGIRTFFPNFF